jgi:CheY-like chemotaxis protein
LEALAVSAADRAKAETGCFSTKQQFGWRMGQLPASYPYVVLVVEDDALIRMDLAAELSASGWAVLEAGSGRDALAICDAGVPIDVLVTDINLGNGTSGWDVARAFWLRDNIPVIYMSGNRDDSQHHVPKSRFMPKPCRAVELIETCLALRQSCSSPARRVSR